MGIERKLELEKTKRFQLVSVRKDEAETVGDIKLVTTRMKNESC